MKISSKYLDMVESAKIIPNNTNVKLLIRHSIRGTLKNMVSPDDITLTEEGIDLAIEFGKGLCMPVGDVYSSLALRCQQTVKYILMGAEIEEKYPITLVDMRQFYTDDLQQSINTFNVEKNGKEVIVKLSKNIKLPGFLSIKEIALNQLRFIFKSEGQPSHIDLFCTHDFQIICLISVLYKTVANIDQAISNWPNVLEGLFLWGNINDFYCVWRKNIRHIINLNI